jgi:hypothetical protein
MNRQEQTWFEELLIPIPRFLKRTNFFRGVNCVLNFEEKGSTKLYAQAEVEAYPGPAVQSVTDSSR